MNFRIRSLPFYLFALIACFHSCTCSQQTWEAVRSDEFPRDESAGRRYRADEILVMYKGTPSDAARDTIRQKLQAAGVDTASVNIRTCNSCNSYVELWQSANIHTVIHNEGIRAGTVSGGSQGVGEDTLAQYSLNFIQHLPVDALPSLRQFEFGDSRPPVSGNGKDTIVVAVLDTGVDTAQVMRGEYVWENRQEKNSAIPDADRNCYPKDVAGWNFVNNSPNIHDDNINLHGTLVSEYIAEQFRSSSKNFVQIMALKTHDNQGRGDLFSSICALHYAMDKGANIINASWGFYYYQDNPHPYLDSLITTVMRQKGILFVTASGNKIDEVDAYARAIYQKKHGVPIPDSLLRNLEIHNFYPACLAAETNNVLVATTTDGRLVSPTQNYSDVYVDFGVIADSVDTAFMKFQVPFTTNPLFISGSSFATAILTGKIGAFADKSAFKSDLDKQGIISNVEAGASGVIQTSSDLKSQERVRDGRYIKRH